MQLYLYAGPWQWPLDNLTPSATASYEGHQYWCAIPNNTHVVPALTSDKCLHELRPARDRHCANAHPAVFAVQTYWPTAAHRERTRAHLYWHALVQSTPISNKRIHELCGIRDQLCSNADPVAAGALTHLHWLARPNKSLVYSCPSWYKRLNGPLGVRDSLHYKVSVRPGGAVTN